MQALFNFIKKNISNNNNFQFQTAFIKQSLFLYDLLKINDTGFNFTLTCWY